jgi:adenylate kinase
MTIVTKLVDDADVCQTGTLAELQGLNPAAIIFLGAPGAGKGTQAQQVANEYSLPYISTGDVFRSHVAKKTALGLKASEAMRRGMLVTDDIVCSMLADYIDNHAYSGCLVLDGFPRSVSQAEWLDEFLRARAAVSRDRSFASPLAIQINVARDQLLRRLSGRRTCPCCGRTYNQYFQPPKNSGICDYDGAKLITRQDDSESVVLERLIIHDRNTLPLTEYYRRKDQLWEIDGNSTVDRVRIAIGRITRMLTI